MAATTAVSYSFEAEDRARDRKNSFISRYDGYTAKLTFIRSITSPALVLKYSPNFSQTKYASSSESNSTKSLNVSYAISSLTS